MKFLIFFLCSLSINLPAYSVSGVNEQSKQEETGVPIHPPSFHWQKQMPAVIEKLAFGSCLQQNSPQPIWQAIDNLKPDLFLFLGDNVYKDFEKPEELTQAYFKLASNKNFQAFASKYPLLATWDDHDYGKNDSGADFAFKADAKKNFLRFFAVSPTDVRRQREGIYYSQIFGSPGKRVQVVLLDTRWFRSPLKKPFFSWLTNQRYAADRDKDKTMLGEEQWQWLEKQLQKPAELRFIVSSIQVINNVQHYEKWANLPNERERFFNLLKNSQASGIILLSGDRHKAQFNKISGVLPYDLYEFTSSSMNVPVPHIKPDPESEYQVGKEFIEENFGIVYIDWEMQRLSVNIVDKDGRVAINKVLPFAQLGAKSTAIPKSVSAE